MASVSGFVEEQIVHTILIGDPDRQVRMAGECWLTGSTTIGLPSLRLPWCCVKMLGDWWVISTS